MELREVEAQMGPTLGCVPGDTDNNNDVSSTLYNLQNLARQSLHCYRVGGYIQTCFFLDLLSHQYPSQIRDM